MPSAVSPNPRAGEMEGNPPDYDAAVDEFLRDIPLNNDTQNTTTQPAKDIDEEITIKKKKKPVPKLDAELLLSQNGLPKLRGITKSRLKFQGKGHEFSDISRLLNTYQLWLDDLFPRAKFRDALTIVEKVGHTKKMQIMRRAWLDATKPHRRDATPEPDDAVMSGALPDNGAENGMRGVEEDDEDIFGPLPTEHANPASRETGGQQNDAPNDDELDALLAENETAATEKPAEPQKRRAPFEEHSEDEDDLDALLAEEAYTSRATVSALNRQDNRRDTDDFADEEEVMASMDMW